MTKDEFKQAVIDRLNMPAGQRSLGVPFLKSLGDDVYQRCVRLAEKHSISVQAVAFQVTFPAPLCVTCKSIYTKRKSSAKAGYYSYCSAKCAQSDPEVRTKFEQSMIRNHGVPYTGMSPKLLKKMRKTQVKTYGSVAKAYEHIQRKSQATHMERYGVKCLSQDREFYETKMLSGFKVKEVTVGNKVFRLRGFEPAAVEWLHTVKRVPVKHIKSTSAEGVPTIWYNYQGKEHAYHPDLLIKNKTGVWGLIEVKSSFTSGITKRPEWWKILKAKAAACTEAGYHFKLLLVLRQKAPHWCVLIDNPHLKTRAEVLAEVEAHRRQLGLSPSHKLDG